MMKINRTMEIEKEYDKRKSKDTRKLTFYVYRIFAITLLLIMIVVCGFTYTKNKPGKNQKPPNLIYIFPDQYRLYSVGLWSEPGYDTILNTIGDPVYTPNLDGLAKSGVIFPNVVSTHPVCSPHRAMLMSGMFPSQNGIEGSNAAANRPNGLRHDIVCFTDVLAQAGYETAYVGKTHWERNEPLFDKVGNYLGTTSGEGGNFANGQDTYIPPGPGRHSNKFWFQALKDNKKPFTYSSEPGLVAGKKDGEVHQRNVFSPIVETDVIVQYLKNENGERDSDKPFSLFWAPHPPHTPYDSPEDTDEEVYGKYYKNKSLDELMLRDNIQSDKRAFNLKGKSVTPKSTPIYFSHVTTIDQQLERIFMALEKSGEAENTIIVFSSDHGEMMGSHHLMRKNLIYEESFRVPFFLKHPKLDHRIDDLMMGTVDVMPTLLGLMGLGDMIPRTVQGTDFSKGIFKGDYDGQKKPVSALYLNAKIKGVRTIRYTYLVHLNGRVEIYDNQKDPYQMNILASGQIPEAEHEFLKTELGKWLTNAGDTWAVDKRMGQHITYPEKEEGVTVTGAAIHVPQYIQLKVGDKHQLKCRITPSNATDQGITWKSSNESVASVNTEGKVTAKESGETVITATSNDGGFVGTCYVTVER